VNLERTTKRIPCFSKANQIGSALLFMSFFIKENEVYFPNFVDRKHSNRGESPGAGEFPTSDGDVVYSDDSQLTITGLFKSSITASSTMYLNISSHA
jgi:hypothetical protein